MNNSYEDIFNCPERRSETRSKADEYSSVEFSTGTSAFNYQFKLWDSSDSGLCILVGEGSAVLDYLKAGDILKMKYYPSELSEPPIPLETEIRHITMKDKGRFKGHYLIGLSVKGKKSG